MTFLQLLILVSSLSFGGVVWLLGRRVYLDRHLNNEELLKEISSSGPFFLFDFNLKNIKTKINLTFLFRRFLKLAKSSEFLKKHFLNFKDYVNGKRPVKSNGCRGYWDKLNGCNEDKIKK